MSDDEEHPRDVRRRSRRAAGDESARIAGLLMRLSPASLGKLELDDDLREVVERSRKVTSPIARRRAERTVAGALRQVDDLAGLSERIANVESTGTADNRLFHLAERWRTRLIEEGSAAAEFPGGATETLQTLIDRARRERETGEPRGAARALFRHVAAALKAPAAAPADETS